MGWVLIVIYVIISMIIMHYFYRLYKDKEEWKTETEKQEKIKKEQEKIAQEIKEKNKQEQEKRDYELHQENIHKELGEIVTRSQTLSQKLIKELGNTKNALDTAEQEYTDGAFAPFWDAVECAVTCLARFDLDVKQLTQNCSEYRTRSQELDSTPPVFNWKKAIDASDTVATTNRLREIIRNAQKNFQFAVIYEQRKTNQLLVSGFTNLAHALNDIAHRIKESTNSLSASIADLSFTVSDTSSRAIEVSEENAQATIKSIQTVKEQLVADAKIEQKREEKEQEYKEKTLVMLDDIRHHRKGR